MKRARSPASSADQARPDASNGEQRHAVPRRNRDMSLGMGLHAGQDLRILQENGRASARGRHGPSRWMRVIAATNKTLRRPLPPDIPRRPVLPARVVRCLPPAARGTSIRCGLHGTRLCRARLQSARSRAGNEMERLRRYPWPGNVRELVHCERMVILFGGKTVLPVDLPPEMTRRASRSRLPRQPAACEPAFLPQSAVLDPDLDFKARAVFEARLEAKLPRKMRRQHHKARRDHRP